MIEDRNIAFGKYNGEPIKKLILTHLGYIMWCLSNLNWFKLTDNEQALYDAMAIAVIESDVETVYPKEELKKHIRDTWAMINKKTPFDVTSSGDVYCPPEKVKEFGLDKYVQMKRKRPLCLADLAGLNRELSQLGFDREVPNYDYDYDEFVEDGLYNDFFY